MNGNTAVEERCENAVCDTVVSASFGAGKVCGLLLFISVLWLGLSLAVLSHVRFMYFALFCLFAFITASAGLFVGHGVRREKLEVSKNMIFGKTMFGNDLYLPTGEITAVGKTFFGGVIITTGNFKLYSFFIRNRQDVIDGILGCMVKG